MRTRLSFLFLLLYSAASAQWSSNPAINTAVCTATQDQRYVTIASDGANGAIIVWEDGRDGASYQLYAQRVNASGVPQWTSNGILICPDGSNQFHSQTVSDGNGGVIVVFEDNRDPFASDLYAQRIDGNGNLLWTTGGAPVSTAPNFQYTPHLITDGSGGAFITWWDNNNGGHAKVLVQHLNGSGVPQWTVNGVMLSNNTKQQEYPNLTSDGAGGVIVAWRDRSSPGVQIAINSQRVNSSGTIQWAASGNTVCNNTSDPVSIPEITSNGNNGAFITWQDYRSLKDRIYLQNMGSNGVIQWIQDGISLCNATGTSGQINPKLVSDGSSGTIVCWNDGRSGSGLYAQRVNSSGTSLWTTDGVLVCGLIDNQYFTPVIAADNSSGAAFAWQDPRSGQDALYAQHLDASANPTLPINGVAVCTASGGQSVPAMVYNSNGTGILAWEDFRGADGDVYANRLTANGVLPSTLLNFTATKQDADAALKWKTANEINTQEFALERSIDGLHFSTIATIAASGTASNNYVYTDRSLPAGVLYYRLRMIDVDGRFSYSPIVRLGDRSVTGVQIYPNPVSTELTISYGGTASGDLLIRLTNLQGQLVRQWKEPSASQLRINLSSIPSGSYQLSVNDGAKVYNEKVMIKR